MKGGAVVVAIAAIVTTLISLGLPPTPFAHPASDHQSLLGKCAGHRSGPRGRGAEYLDIKTVTGAKFTEKRRWATVSLRDLR